MWASGSTFSTLGVGTVLGRTFTPADDERGGGADRAGGSHQPRVLGAALCRRTRRHRAHADAGRGSLHGHRGHTARFLRPRCRPLVRCRHPVGCRATRPGRAGVSPGSADVVVAASHGSTEVRADRGARDGGAAHAAAADPRSHTPRPADRDAEDLRQPFTLVQRPLADRDCATSIDDR